MKHYCPMCGEQWNEDVCAVCGWHESKHRASLEIDECFVGGLEGNKHANKKLRPMEGETPKALDSIVDVVLAYRPKARSQPAIQRKRRATKIAKEK